MLLEINQLHFSHDPIIPLFEGLSFGLQEGNTMAIAGESGCGKSTLLAVIYGLLDWEKGSLTFDGKNLLGPKGNLVPGEKNMKLVSQHFDLMPYATVAENVGKYLSNTSLSHKKDTVAELLELVELSHLANALPKNLSGGEQQRAAIARALSELPQLLLLDEPFSQLDFPRKIKLRERLFGYVKEKNIAVLISTHELQEITPWMDELLLMKNGKIIQHGTPEEVYRNPKTPYVAGLFGEFNLFSQEEQTTYGLSSFCYYPHEIFLAEEGFYAEVKESRFSGSHYWNLLILRNKKIILYTPYKMMESWVKVAFKK